MQAGQEDLPPVPHRRELREWMLPITRPSTARAMALVVLDFVLYAACMAAIVWLRNPWLKCLAGLACGFVIGRLFILGHDACHQSFTRHRRFNRWLGRLLFLPSLTPYSLWEVGHNVVHHGYTNLKGFDFVWEPCSPEEYQALPRWRRGLERVYRSGWAPWLYYLVEVWWARMLFPSRRRMPTRRAVFTLDGLLVTGYGLLWMAALVWAAQATSQSVGWMLAGGFVLPFLFWNAMIGFVVYVHHTHQEVVWHTDKKSWAAAQPFVSTTVHITFRSAMGSALHHILEHTAHHVDMGVPLYRLKKAQALLESRLKGRIVVQAFSWRWYFATARACKLYDFAEQRWVGFLGVTALRKPAGS
ncbi:fatty acid desaturase [Xylophilus rhododendri]|uniref:Fatty acid desaturase n=1 Tax=Xylophilus rhododendri TaxID=2697032 RepID=A0A857J8Y6_9BURK|nr:fatty acid desaturase [Xylophilus rhododendri]QHJ00188.1 fatty acid desaturase [Xylophilus rhododendri]